LEEAMTIFEHTIEKVQLALLDKVTGQLTQLRDWLLIPDAEPSFMNQVRQVLVSHLAWLRQKSMRTILGSLALTALAGFMTGILLFALT